MRWQRDKRRGVESRKSCHAFQKRGKVVHAVDDVNIELWPGEIVGLIGENGCGKSTLGRSIVGLAKPNSGAILLDGVDLSTLRGKELRRKRRAIQ